MKNLSLYSFVLIVLIFWTLNPIVDAVTPDGKALYKAANCATCHGKKGKSMLNIAPSLQNPALTLEKRIEIITKGSEKDPTMIAFSPTYSDAEIEAIARYTMTFIKE